MLDQKVDHHFALGREAAHEERVEAAEQVPIEVAQIVARRVRAVCLDLEARRLRTTGEATVTRARGVSSRVGWERFRNRSRRSASNMASRSSQTRQLLKSMCWQPWRGRS